MRSFLEWTLGWSKTLLGLAEARSLHFLENEGYTEHRGLLPLPLQDQSLRRRPPEGESFRGVGSARELPVRLGCRVEA